MTRYHESCCQKKYLENISQDAFTLTMPLENLNAIKNNLSFQNSPTKQNSPLPREGFSFKPSKNREKARNIDRVSRFLFPLAFILFNVGYWLVYLVLWEPVVDKHADTEGVTMPINLNDD